MATQVQPVAGWKKIQKFLSASEMGMPIAIIGILAWMILPLPPILLDILIVINITTAILMVMTSIQVKLDA